MDGTSKSPSNIYRKASGVLYFINFLWDQNIDSCSVRNAWISCSRVLIQELELNEITDFKQKRNNGNHQNNTAFWNKKKTIRLLFRQYIKSNSDWNKVQFKHLVLHLSCPVVKCVQLYGTSKQNHAVTQHCSAMGQDELRFCPVGGSNVQHCHVSLSNSKGITIYMYIQD